MKKITRKEWKDYSVEQAASIVNPYLKTGMTLDRFSADMTEFSIDILGKKFTNNGWIKNPITKMYQPKEKEGLISNLLPPRKKIELNKKTIEQKRIDLEKEEEREKKEKLESER